MKPAASDIVDEAPAGAAASVERVQPAPRPGEAAPGELGGRLAGLSLPRQVAVLAVWPLLEQLMAFLVGTVDIMLAAQLEPDTLARDATDALGVAGYIGWLMGMMQGAVGVGASALVARAIGGRHRALANSGLGQAVLLAVGVGTAIGTLVFVTAPWIAYLAGIEGQAHALCVGYLRILASVQPLSAVLFVAMACLRGAGDTGTPFWVMVLVNIVNTTLSVLFVWGPAPIGGHGVMGIALGTSLAWVAGAVVVVAQLFSGRSTLRLYVHRLRPHWHTLQRICRVGLPSLLESSGMWLGNFAVLMIVGNFLGPGAPGSHMIAIRIEAISFLGGFAIGTAAATLAGQYLGAGNPEMAKQAVRLCWALGAGAMTVMGLVFIAIPEQLTAIISDTPQHLEMVPPLLRICGFAQFFFGTYAVLSQALRGAGDTTAAMAMTYSSTFLVRLPAAFLGAWLTGWTLWGLWIGLCGELVVRGCLFAARFLHGGWQRVKV